MPVFLQPYPGTVCGAVDAIEASVQWGASGNIAITYRLRGRPDGLRIPYPALPGAMDGLWQHTCFEAFVAGPSGTAYREFNFSPSGQWAAYEFISYRERDAAFALPETPRIAFRSTGDGLELEAVLPVSALPECPKNMPLSLGLTAVIESADGGLSYWALAHPGPRPDFHQREAFTLTVPLPEPHS